MSFNVSAAAYSSFMGQFSEPLASLFADWAGVVGGQRALDVGCGTGALTEQLVARAGPAMVVAVDPSLPFVDAMRHRFPTVEVLVSAAEHLPFDDGEFDITLAQLVIHLMKDARTGLSEMARVTRPGGIVAACVWDHAGGRGPLATFWDAVRDLDPNESGESDLIGTRDGDLLELYTDVGLLHIETSALTVTRHYSTFIDWWQPYTLGVGPAGAYVASLSAVQRDALRDRCAELLPAGSLEVSALAWCARGVVTPPSARS